MKIFLCNEVLRELDFTNQCRFVRETGYDGLEIAPFTLASDPSQLTAELVGGFRKIADDEGVTIGGLHWLLAAPQGLSITTDDNRIATATLDVARRLVDLCAELGGSYLVHGSPGQRLLEENNAVQGRRRAEVYFTAIAKAAEAAGVLYLIEPLSRADTLFINSVEEAVTLIEAIGSPALGTMVDCYAAATNGEDIAKLLDRWVPRRMIRHVHFNDANKRGPGEGALDFSAILDMLHRLDYLGTTAVEPFVYLPDGPACAARAIGYLRGVQAGRR